MAAKFRLKLYITGRTARAERALRSLREVCDERFAGQYEICVIDVLERPQLAEDERILATPTVIKELPPPLRRVVGDLSDLEQTLVGLDLAGRSE